MDNVQRTPDSLVVEDRIGSYAPSLGRRVRSVFQDGDGRRIVGSRLRFGERGVLGTTLGESVIDELEDVVVDELCGEVSKCLNGCVTH